MARWDPFSGQTDFDPVFRNVNKILGERSAFPRKSGNPALPNPRDPWPSRSAGRAQSQEDRSQGGTRANVTVPSGNRFGDFSRGVAQSLRFDDLANAVMAGRASPARPTLTHHLLHCLRCVERDAGRNLRFLDLQAVAEDSGGRLHLAIRSTTEPSDVETQSQQQQFMLFSERSSSDPGLFSENSSMGDSNAFH